VKPFASKWGTPVKRLYREFNFRKNTCHASLPGGRRGAGESSIGCVPVTPKEVSNTKMSTSLLMWLEAVVWFEEDYFSLEQFTFAAEVTPIYQGCGVSSLAR
jgi:hypothetical protein